MKDRMERILNIITSDKMFTKRKTSYIEEIIDDKNPFNIVINLSTFKKTNFSCINIVIHNRMEPEDKELEVYTFVFFGIYKNLEICKLNNEDINEQSFNNLLNKIKKCKYKFNFEEE